MNLPQVVCGTHVHVHKYLLNSTPLGNEEKGQIRRVPGLHSSPMSPVKGEGQWEERKLMNELGSLNQASLEYSKSA